MTTEVIAIVTENPGIKLGELLKRLPATRNDWAEVIQNMAETGEIVKLEVRIPDKTAMFQYYPWLTKFVLTGKIGVIVG